MDGYDEQTFEAIIREHLHHAARAGLDGDAIAGILLNHRDGVMCKGLAEHAGYHTYNSHDPDRSCNSNSS